LRTDSTNLTSAFIEKESQTGVERPVDASFFDTPELSMTLSLALTSLFCVGVANKSIATIFGNPFRSTTLSVGIYLLNSDSS